MKFRSQVYTSVAGSVGGITYFNGRYGHLIARARSIPTQPGTTPQAQMRAAWSDAQAFWVNATESERGKWQQYAATVTYQGPMGAYNINGRERFLATLSIISYLNTVLGAGLILSAAAPKDIGWLLLSGLDTQSPTLGEIGFKLKVTNPNDHDIQVYATLSQALPDTINFWKGPWDPDQLKNVSITTLSSGTIDFYGLEAGKTYFIRIRGISDTAEHRFSEQFIIHTVAEVGV